MPDRWTLHEGDCAEVLKGLEANSIDALVCDPPAGIAFMGRSWDSDKGGREEWIAWLAGVMGEALRVAKPGAHALVWALPRTSHWTGTALERAGWQVRDICTHLFGSGFPKSLNLGNGLGTALKPAAEFWFLCRKPLAGTVAACVQRWGTGAINVDGCRVEAVECTARTRRGHGWDRTNALHGKRSRDYSLDKPLAEMGGHPSGRWPPNLLLSCCGSEPHEEGCAVAELDRQSGVSRSAGGRIGNKAGGIAVPGGRYLSGDPGFGDSGGASRFFPVFRYEPKASRADREQGCDGLPARTGAEAVDREEGSAGTQSPRAGANRTASSVRNHHPTVKPQGLMRWLCRLITPPGGTVLDPFAGSGSTGVAALLEGFGFVGVEREPEYAAIARSRLAWAQGEAERLAAQPRQLSLLGEP
jgi:site-specific DNA-methyltransferase (adenine-specific)